MERSGINHVHGIIGITVDPDGGDVERRNANAPTDGNDATHCRGSSPMNPYGRSRRTFGGAIAGSLSTIMRQFKSMVTKRINRRRGTPGEPVWQRNFYERVVRNRRELDRIRRYIRRNPARWHRDRHYPGA